MSGYQYTWKGGFEDLRNADVTAAETLYDGSTPGYTYCWSDRPGYAFKLAPQVNYMQIIFSGGRGFGQGLHEFSAVAGKGVAFQIDGWPPTGPMLKICDGSAHLGGSQPFGVAEGHDPSECLACCSISLDDMPHVTTINVNNVDSTDEIANITLDCLGYEYIAVTFPDVSFPVNAHARYF